MQPTIIKWILLKLHHRKTIAMIQMKSMKLQHHKVKKKHTLKGNYPSHMYANSIQDILLFF